MVAGLFCEVLECCYVVAGLFLIILVLLCGCWVVLSILECCYAVAGLF